MRKLVKFFVLVWLRFWARRWLRWNRPLFVAVAGSSGKTSTVAGIVAALSPTHRVRSGSGFNSETGVPMSILGLPARYSFFGWIATSLAAPFHACRDTGRWDVYVAEYSIDRPGDMRANLKVRVPDIAVLTSVGLEHAGYFPQETLDEVLEAIADEEVSLLTALPATSVAVVPASDPRVAARLDAVKARVVTVGDREGSGSEVMRYRVTEHGTDADVFFKGVTYPAAFPRPVTRAAVTSAALAAAAAHEAGARFGEALLAIARGAEVPPGRGRVLRGRKGTLLIDSSYNATPEAVADALRLLNDLGGERRRVAVLGDMRELGVHAAAAHRGLADAVAESCDVALLVGPNMNEHLAPLLADRVTQAEAFPDATALLARLDDLVHEGDVVLVKGSQNALFLERVTQALLADPADVRELPRRGARWDAVRAAAA